MRPVPRAEQAGATDAGVARNPRLDARAPALDSRARPSNAKAAECRLADGVAQALQAHLDAAGAPRVPRALSEMIERDVTWKIAGTVPEDRKLRLNGLVSNGGIVPFSADGRLLALVSSPHRLMHHSDRIRLFETGKKATGRIDDKKVIAQLGKANTATSIPIAEQLARVRDLPPAACLSLATGLLKLFSCPFIASDSQLQMRVLEDVCSSQGQVRAPSRREMFKGPHPDSSRFSKEDGEILSEYVVVQLSNETMDALERAIAAWRPGENEREIAAVHRIGGREEADSLSSQAQREIDAFDEHYANTFSALPPEKMGQLRFAFAKMMVNVVPEALAASHDFCPERSDRYAHLLRAGDEKRFPPRPEMKVHQAAVEKEAALGALAGMRNKPADRNLGNPYLKFGLRKSIRAAARLSIDPVWNTGGATAQTPHAWSGISPATARALVEALQLKRWDLRGDHGDSVERPFFVHAFENFAERYPRFFRDFLHDLLGAEPERGDLRTLESARTLQVIAGEVAAAIGAGSDRSDRSNRSNPLGRAVAAALDRRGIDDIFILERAILEFVARADGSKYGDRIPAIFELSGQYHQELLLRWLRADPAHVEKLVEHVASRAKRLLAREERRAVLAARRVLAPTSGELTGSAPRLARHQREALQEIRRHARAVSSAVADLEEDKDALDQEIWRALERIRAPLRTIQAAFEQRGVPPAMFYRFCHQILFSLNVSSMTKVSHPALARPEPLESRALIELFLRGEDDADTGLQRRDPANKRIGTPMSVKDALLKYVKKHKTLVGRTMVIQERLDRIHARHEGYLPHATVAGLRGFGFWFKDLEQATIWARVLYGCKGEYPSDLAQFSDPFINAGLYLTTDADPVTATNHGATNASGTCKSVTRSMATSYEYAARLLWGGSSNASMLTLMKPSVSPTSVSYLVDGENNWDDEDAATAISPERPVFSAIFLPPEGQKHPDAGDVAIARVVWHQDTLREGAKIGGVTEEQLRLIEAAVAWQNRAVGGRAGAATFSVPRPDQLSVLRDALASHRRAAGFEQTLSFERRSSPEVFERDRRIEMAAFKGETPKMKAMRIEAERAAIARRTYTVTLAPDAAIAGGLLMKVEAPVDGAI